MSETELREYIMETSIKILFLIREENDKKPEHLKRSEYYLVKDAVSLAKKLVEEIVEDKRSI
jgi:hypothetical protein